MAFTDPDRHDLSAESPPRAPSARGEPGPVEQMPAAASTAVGGNAPRTATATRTGTDLTEVLVLTGTDHHPFDRLVEWVDRWYADRSQDGPVAAVMVQTGTASTRCSAPSQPMLTRGELDGYAGRADIVVCHGGPGTIHDALREGIRPIVVPRNPDLGEHVDDHQMLFARFLADQGAIDVADDEGTFAALMDAAVAEPLTQRHDVGEDSAAAQRRQDTMDRIDSLIRNLLVTGRRAGRPRLGRRFRRHPARLNVLFACSSGGHLGQAWQLMPWAAEHDRHWVTFDTVDAASLLERESWESAHSPTTRHLGNLIRNTFMAWRVLRRRRPDIVVSTGAGVAVPYFWLSRLFGIPTVYIEVFDRIDTATLTARLVAPATDLMLVQWPRQRRLYPDAVVVGHLI